MASAPLIEPAEIGQGSKRSFLLSLVATFSVAVVPTFVAFAVLVYGRPDPQIVAAVLASILLTAGAIVVAAALWARQPESEGLSLGDLMLWSWVRQYRAERVIADATATLGFDREGRFIALSTASQRDQFRAVRAIAKALDEKSSYTIGHSRRVERHARRTGEALGLSKDEVGSLALAALLHDVGNVGLADEVLRKAGELTLEERFGIEAHVLLGARMVEMAGDLAVVEGIRHHHERWDGQGYPDHLSGERIPLFARVIGIAEAFDAMTSTRPYRQSFSKQHAIDVLRSESGSQFDGELVETFVSTLRKPIGLVERFPFLAAIERQLREVWLVFRRIGAVALSATASTIAIALILGSTVLSPGTPTGTAPEIAEQQSPADPIDSVLGERVGPSDDAVAEVTDAVTDGDAAPDDHVLGLRVTQDDTRSASVEGPDLKFDGGDGTPTDPGTDPGTGGGTPPPDGGGQPGPVGPGTPGGGGTNPGGGNGGNGGSNPGAGNGGSKTGGEQDKNPDAPGNGYGNENAPGHNKDDDGAPGNSGSAPGQTGGDTGAPGNSGDAPGHNKDEDAPTAPADEAPGNSENAPGQTKDKDKA